MTGIGLLLLGFALLLLIGEGIAKGILWIRSKTWGKS